MKVRISIPMVLRLLVVLCTLAVSRDAGAFYTALHYETENRGQREVLSFHMPPGSEAPRLTLMGPKTLRVTIPGILALPFPTVELGRTRYLRSFQVEEIAGGEMGLYLTIALKQPYLNFRGHMIKARDSVNGFGPERGQLYQLDIEPYPEPSAAGPTKLLEGRIMPGQDATLVVISYTGNGWVDGLDNRRDGHVKAGETAEGLGSAVDYGSHTLRLSWPGAILDDGWKPRLSGGRAAHLKPAGMIDRVDTVAFSGQVEMEMAFHPSVAQVRFFRSPEAGTFIVELVPESGPGAPGRALEAEEIIKKRKAALKRGEPMPLNRLVPLFINGPDTLEVGDKVLDEAFFLENAKEAERDHQFHRARSYLDNLLENFPDTKNREMITLYKLDLALRSDWKPGWKVAELERVLSVYPNTSRYSYYRLQQLKLLNEAEMHERAAAMMRDPNLPKNSAEVALERGEAALKMGLLNEAEEQLEHVLKRDRRNGKLSARAHFLKAHMHMHRRCGDHAKLPVNIWGRWNNRCDVSDATRVLENLEQHHISHISDDPKRLLELADLYYRDRRYAQAHKYYTTLKNHYPTLEPLASWAMLRSAESLRYMGGNHDEAIRLLRQIALEHPESDAQTWAKIFLIELNHHEKDKAKKMTSEERLKALDKIIDETSLTDAVVEAHLHKAEIYAREAGYQKAMESLNTLLLLTSRESAVGQADDLKMRYMTQGMLNALETERPEYAIRLAQTFGRSWLKDENVEQPTVLLAEAMMRVGMIDQALELLKGVNLDSARQLQALGKSFSEKNPLESWKGLQKHPNIAPEAARVRLDRARHQSDKQDWEGVLALLERLPERLLNEAEQADRLRLMARAEFNRGRFPQAVGHLELLVVNRPMGNGKDSYWYATVLQDWKGNDRALPTFQKVAEEAEDAETKALATMRLGNIMLDKGEREEARRLYKKASELVPKSTWARLSQENDAQLKMLQEMTQ